MKPRLGILAFNPIQYQAPLYQRLASRSHVDLDVLYLSDRGISPAVDAQFGVTVTWDIDLLSGYSHDFLTTATNSKGLTPRIWQLREWIISRDMVVIHGYSDLWMLLAVLLCHSCGIPYMLRCCSVPESRSTGIRRHIRNIITRRAIAGSAGCLAIGQLNRDFYIQQGARNITWAPYSVDHERFSRQPESARADLLARWGIRYDYPVIMFCGKLYPGKRPLDLSAAVKIIPEKTIVLFVGDGVLAEQVRASLPPACGAVTGFINQSELPAYYHAADILVLPSQSEMWGLVVNEAMAAGTFPVVSDRVGSAPDLVKGVGEVYRCGDIAALAEALRRGLARIKDPRSRAMVQQHVAHYSPDITAAGFEEAALAISSSSRLAKR